MISTVFALTVFETPIEKIIDAKNASRIFFVKFNILPPSNYILKTTKPEKSMINIKNLYIYLKKKYFLLIIIINLNMIEDTIKKYLKRKIKHFDESQDEINDSINYFRRSRIHWLFMLNILNAYYEKKIITKSDLIHKIQVSHITILKYIKESIDLKIIIEERSQKDKRKVGLIPSNELIQSFENFFYDETRSLKDLFNERMEN